MTKYQLYVFAVCVFLLSFSCGCRSQYSYVNYSVERDAKYKLEGISKIGIIDFNSLHDLQNKTNAADKESVAMAQDLITAHFKSNPKYAMVNFDTERDITAEGRVRPKTRMDGLLYGQVWYQTTPEYRGQYPQRYHLDDVLTLHYWDVRKDSSTVAEKKNLTLYERGHVETQHFRSKRATAIITLSLYRLDHNGMMVKVIDLIGTASKVYTLDNGENRSTPVRNNSVFLPSGRAAVSSPSGSDPVSSASIQKEKELRAQLLTMRKNRVHPRKIREVQAQLTKLRYDRLRLEQRNRAKNAAPAASAKNTVSASMISRSGKDFFTTDLSVKHELINSAASNLLTQLLPQRLRVQANACFGKDLTEKFKSSNDYREIVKYCVNKVVENSSAEVAAQIPTFGAYKELLRHKSGKVDQDDIVDAINDNEEYLLAIAMCEEALGNTAVAYETYRLLLHNIEEPEYCDEIATGLARCVAIMGIKQQYEKDKLKHENTKKHL